MFYNMFYNYMFRPFSLDHLQVVYILLGLESNVSYIYTGCHRRNGPNFGRVFLMLNYTDITQNTYVQS